MSSTEDFKTFFLEADKDNSGQLSYSELVAMMKKHDYQGSEKDILEFFHAADASADGLISFDEYMVAMGEAPKQYHSQAEVLRLFHQCDRDGNGVISGDELRAMYEELGRCLSTYELGELMAMANQDGSGTINYEEFASGLFSM